MKTDAYYNKFPKSPDCACDICSNYCRRPGWFLVEEARSAIDKGLSDRLMLELSADFPFGVLAPAFTDNEGNIALRMHSGKPCTFLKNQKCEIHNETFFPLECRYCHHSRKNMGLQCHLEIARDWNSSKGKRLVRKWIEARQIKLRHAIPAIGQLTHLNPIDFPDFNILHS